MIINGKVYHGNVTIKNGRIISENSKDISLSTKEIDEIKKEPSNDVNTVYINSDINVKLSACNTNDIIAHLHGSAITDSVFNFSMTRFGEYVQISVKLERTSISCENCGEMFISSGSSFVINQLSIGDINGLTLDIQIPSKVFKKLSIESKNADIDVDSSVYASDIYINSKNGDVDTSAIFQILNIDCKNGNITVDSEAHCNVGLEVISKNGNVDVNIRNLNNSKVSVDSKNGRCKNKPNLNGVHTAVGYLSSKNGNVKFH